MTSSPQSGGWTGAAVEAVDLVKRFDETLAVDGVSFSVPTGSVLGLLGPNGAGKTTTVRMLTTMSLPTSGTGRVAGHDIREDPDAVRRSMGLTGQNATVDEFLTGRENIRLIGSFAGLGRAEVRRIGDELLERFSLTDAADRTVKTYSGGMRRRLDLAVSLVATPPVLFLDEPTTGLDPRSRTELWEVLRGRGFMFTVMFPITFLANTFAPTENMPRWLRFVAEWNPISSLTQATRELWGNGPPAPESAAFPLHHPVVATLLWSLAITAVIAPLALRTFREKSKD